MLDEDEYAEVHHLYGECMKGAKEFRLKWGVPMDASLEERFRPVTDWYEGRTGMRGCHHNAVMHHRLALYGPPCRDCGKPLRTPQARICAACGGKLLGKAVDGAVG